MLHPLSKKYAPYLFVAPFVLTFIIFSVYPLLKSGLLSFYATSGPSHQRFVGLDNFIFLIRDPGFHKAVANTCVFAVFYVFLQLPLSLGLAVLLNRRQLTGRTLFRFAFFSPRLVGMVFVAVLFSLVFAPRFGLLNQGLHALIGLSPDIQWLSNPRLVMPALVLTSLWLHVGFNMIYFLAALQNVNADLYDAASVDGARAIQRFIHVTLPAIRPVAVFLIILSTISAFQLFELPYVMLNQTAGPDDAGLTIVMYLYENGFVTGDLGYAVIG